MKHLAISTRRRAERGVIMAVALFMVSLAAASSLLMARTMLDHQRMNARRRDLTRSFYAAEAGVHMVIDWGNDNAGYSLDPSVFTYVPPSNTIDTTSGFVYDVGDLEHRFPNLHAALQGGPIVLDRDDLDDLAVTASHKLGDFYAEAGNEVGFVESISIMLPTDPAAPALPAGSTLDPEIVVIAQGKSAATIAVATNNGAATNQSVVEVDTGEERTGGLNRTVVAFMDISPFLRIILPSALISNNTAAAFGNARIHWGEAWSKQPFDMLNRSQMDYVMIGNSNYDKFAKYRTESQIRFPSSWQFDGSAPYQQGRLYDDGNWVSGKNTVLSRPGLYPDGTGGFRDAFYQNIPAGVLQWPNFKDFYHEFKEFSKTHGRYYTTNSSGQIFRQDGTQVTDFGVEFGHYANRDNAPYDFVFIDTINQLPPAADGSNLASISISGSAAAAGHKGIFYICANFSATGTGSPPLVNNAEKPVDADNDGVPESGTVQSPGLDKIMLDGVLYTAGTLALGGNNGIYGCAVAERGFAGGGTPDIYYNWNMRNGMNLQQGNQGSRFRVILTRSYSENNRAGI